MSASSGANGSLPKEDCERRVDRALAHASFVKFMVEKMAEAGCSLGPAGRDGKFIRVEDCQNNIMGGFTPGDGVTVCHNNIGSQAELENTLTHELIHAYDHCRARGMDFRNCEHHACTEIRAANLSGDCHFGNEVARGNLGFYKQHQRCVKRRAALSVATNANCRGSRATQAVDKVFDTCFKDTAPFAWIP